MKCRIRFLPGRHRKHVVNLDSKLEWGIDRNSCLCDQNMFFSYWFNKALMDQYTEYEGLPDYKNSGENNQRL